MRVRQCLFVTGYMMYSSFFQKIQDQRFFTLYHYKSRIFYNNQARHTRASLLQRLKNTFSMPIPCSNQKHQNHNILPPPQKKSHLAKPFIRTTIITNQIRITTHGSHLTSRHGTNTSLACKDQGFI